MSNLFRVFGVLGMLAMFGLSGCAQKSSDTQYYDRANKASSESLKGLDKD